MQAEIIMKNEMVFAIYFKELKSIMDYWIHKELGGYVKKFRRN